MKSKGHRLSDTDKQRIIELYESGLSPVNIGKEIDFDHMTIRNYLKREGLYKPRSVGGQPKQRHEVQQSRGIPVVTVNGQVVESRQFDRLEQDLIKNLYSYGITFTEIASIVHATPEGVRKYLIQQGIHKSSTRSKGIATKSADVEKPIKTNKRSRASEELLNAQISLAFSTDVNTQSGKSKCEDMEKPAPVVKHVSETVAEKKTETSVRVEKPTKKVSKAPKQEKKSSKVKSGDKKVKREPKKKSEFSMQEKIAYCDMYYGKGGWKFMTKEELKDELRKDLGVV